MNPVQNAMQVASQFTRISPNMNVPQASPSNTRPWFVGAGMPPSAFQQGIRQRAAAATITQQAPAATSANPGSAGPTATVSPAPAQPGISGAFLGDYSGWWKWLTQRARFAYENIRASNKLFVGQNVFSTTPNDGTLDPSGAATTAAGMAPAMNPTQTLPGGWPTHTKVGVQIAEKSSGGLPPNIVLPAAAAAVAVAPSVAMRPDRLATQLVRGPQAIVDPANAKALQNFYHTYRNY
jgi:hypothetical protein